MKKIILIISAFVLLSASVIAQETNNSSSDKVRFGLKIGANLSNVYDSKGEEFKADSKMGFAGGAFVSIPIGNFLGIQPELLFSQKGFSATGSLLGSTYKFTRTTNYIDIPLLIAIRPVPQVTILAGPQFSYLMKQHDVFSAGSSSVEQETVFQNDNIRKNTFCFTGGIDFNLKNIVIGTRAGWDLMNNNGDGTSTTPRYKNVWYQATLGIRF
jgi:hypothetical protein